MTVKFIKTEIVNNKRFRLSFLVIFNIMKP